jgi:hypothetical protein
VLFNFGNRELTAKTLDEPGQAGKRLAAPAAALLFPPSVEFNVTLTASILETARKSGARLIIAVLVSPFASIGIHPMTVHRIRKGKRAVVHMHE